MENKKDLLIIGAGLNGLYLATLLQSHFNITILEARKRTGGRVLTTQGHDLGPSWIWPHQKHILTLIQDLGLELFSQYTKGDALYDAPEGVQRFNAPPSAPSYRVKGGLETLISSLSDKLPSAMIHTDEEVIKIQEDNDRLIASTHTKQYKSHYVISSLAPRLACKNISYEPVLDKISIKAMLQTPTWMGHSAKCVIEFETAFWKEEGLNGFIYSPLGPLGEIHDASTDTQPALFGFLHTNASTDNIYEDVAKQMKRLFPKQEVKKIYFIDWREEKFSSSIYDKKGLSAHPEYGLNLSHFNEKMFFTGTETSYENGGYLEGAVISAKLLAQRLLQK